MKKHNRKAPEEKLPNWTKETPREFKARKRKEAKELEAALRKFHRGSAFLPRVQGVYIGMMVMDVARARKEWQKWWKDS